MARPRPSSGRIEQLTNVDRLADLAIKDGCCVRIACAPASGGLAGRGYIKSLGCAPFRVIASF